ncbi:hypothetical protein E2P71_09430 [Candidatus Bathyarchaeota archaeon]|nr:hypothetical protein E2P71_09430 [Candidatus Bathyarchaeota archaeon]
MRYDPYLDDAVKEILDQTLMDDYLEKLWQGWVKLQKEYDTPFKLFYLGNLHGSLAFLYSSYNSKRISELEEGDIEILVDKVVGQLNKKGAVIDRFEEKKINKTD